MKIVQIEPLGITDEQLKSLVEKLENNGDEYIAYDSRETDTDKLIERVKDADVVVLANQPFPAEVVEKCEKLKMISVAFTGVDHVAVDECKKRGIAYAMRQDIRLMRYPNLYSDLLFHFTERLMRVKKI